MTDTKTKIEDKLRKVFIKYSNGVLNRTGHTPNYAKEFPTLNLEEALAEAMSIIDSDVIGARLKQYTQELLDYYPTDVFPEPTADDYERINKWDSSLNTRLHCDGIRHAVTLLREIVKRDLEDRAEADQLRATQRKG